jgi:hypothetical protein
MSNAKHHISSLPDSARLGKMIENARAFVQKVEELIQTT